MISFAGIKSSFLWGGRDIVSLYYLLVIDFNYLVIGTQTERRKENNFFFPKTPSPEEFHIKIEAHQSYYK
jgi:hypothetical protein